MNLERMSKLQREHHLLSDALVLVTEARALDHRPYPLDKIQQDLKANIAQVVKDAGECAVERKAPAEPKEGGKP